MGSEYSTSNPPTLAVRVAGTAPVEKVELYRGLERIYCFVAESDICPDRVRLLWSGASRKTSYSGVVWDGSLAFRGAKISGVETLRFDSPRSQVTQGSETSLRWHAWGCGYPMGLLIELDRAADAQLQLAVRSQAITGPGYGGHGEKGPRRISFAPAEAATCHVSLRELQSGPWEMHLGVLERTLTVSLAPKATSTIAGFRFTDDSPHPGINPYWVRVTQSDMEMAWSSPVFVDYAPPGRSV